MKYGSLPKIRRNPYYHDNVNQIQQFSKKANENI